MPLPQRIGMGRALLVTNAPPVNTYLLLEEQFLTDDAAPLPASAAASNYYATSPAPGNPVTGGWNLFDQASAWSISTGSLRWSAGSASTNGMGLMELARRPRRRGRTVKCSYRFTGAANRSSLRLGWNNIPGRDNTIGSISSGARVALLGMTNGVMTFDNSSGTQVTLPYVPVVDTDYELASTQLSAGGMVFAKINGVWELMWVDRSESAPSLSPVLNAINSAATASANGQIDYAHEGKITLATDYDSATLHQSTPISGTPYTGDADGIIELTITAPGSLTSNSFTFDFRKNGGDFNRLTINSSGNLGFQQYVGNVAQGSSTNLSSSAWTGGATRTLIIVMRGATLDFYTYTGAVVTKRGTQQTDSSFAANTGVLATAVAGAWTISELVSSPRTSALYAALDNLRTITAGSEPSMLIFDGDSIMWGQGATNGVDDIPSLINTALANAYGVVNLGVSGQRADQLFALMPTKVVPYIHPANHKHIYTVLIGTNDIFHDDSAATIEARLTSIVNYAKLLGCTVAIGTLLPSSADTATWTTRKNAVNAWILAGSSGADIIIDYAGLPHAADPSNLTYYQSGGTHPALPLRQDTATLTGTQIAAAI